MLLVLGAGGCETDPAPKVKPLVTMHPAEVEPPQQAEADDAVTAAVRAHAELVAAAQRPPIPADPAAARPAANEVMWLAPGSSDGATSEPAASELPQMSVVSAANTTTVMDAEAMAPHPAGRGDVLLTLFERIDAAGESPFDRALRAVGVSLSLPENDLNPQYMESLSNEQQHAVRLYHDLMQSMRRQMLADGGRLDRDAFAARLDDLFGQQPVTIRDLKLCRRVNGYGVYEPFESDTFLAGREQRAIVYVELDDFAALDRGDGSYIVDLQQEVTLYSADGLAVWRNEPAQITDTSANRRRDFFIVQLIKLPERLSVGKYRLKVRVTDLNGGSIDERGIDLNLVADRALVVKPTQESAPLR